LAAIAFLAERMRLGFGVDLLIDQLARGLAHRGHDVTVFTCYTDGTYENGPYRIVTFGVPNHPEAVVWDWRARDMARGSGLCDLPMDVWFAATPPFFSLLPLLGGRGVAIDCGVSDWSAMPLPQRRNARTTEVLQQRYYFRSAARIVTISGWLRDNLPDALRPRTVPILLGADHYPVADNEARSDFRERLGISNEEVLSLYVGRLNPHAQPYKGTARLLAMHQEIMEKHPEAKLAMAGFGNDDDAAWIRSQGAMPLLNVAVEDMPKLFAAADVYVTASAWEGFDLPLVEAQRSGKPVVAFRIGAHPEVVDDGNSGFLVDNDTDFVTALGRLVSNESLRREAAAAATDWSSRFRWDDTVEMYDALVGGVLAEIGPVLPEEASRPAPATSGTGAAVCSHPAVSAPILNYGADEDTLVRCIGSVLESRCGHLLEVVVVDNGSTRNQGALDAVGALDERVRIVRLRQNLGFAGGINRGLAVVRGDWVLILNNDTEVDPLALDACAAVLENEGTDCIAAVPKILLRNFPGVIDAMGNAVDGMGRAYNVGVGHLDVGQYDHPTRVFGPCFAAALFRREAFDIDKVGPLDSAYFMYYEDVDWNWRANLLGFRSQSVPWARVYHDHSKTTREQPYEFKFELIHQHLLATVLKNMPAKAAARVTGHHLLKHLWAAVKGDSTASRMRIIAGAAALLPDTMAKRRWVRKRRQVGDELVADLAHLEPSFFESASYVPVLDLHNVTVAYRRRWEQTGDARFLEIADRAWHFAGRLGSIDPGTLRRDLLPLLQDEPDAVVDLIRRLDPDPV
jgi:GT2 family glycosyltransferase/glycosyltransferase involved in cell wall biosynthesis